MSDPLPRAHGAPVLEARYKGTPEDFLVEELPSFEATGEGEHLLLTVEKIGMNTAYAARKLAAWAGIPEMGVGVAGMKDRHGRTRQRFSVHLPRRVAPDAAALESDDFHVLASHWHNRKLSRGALLGNRFSLVLREAHGDREAVDARLRAIEAGGLPNYFGEQRFGRDGDNVAQALAMFAGRRVRREQRGMLLSAARSHLFNRVLGVRVETGSWDRSLDGEVWMLDGSRSVFGPEPLDDALAARLAAFDIHPTGPLWGSGELRTRSDAHALEEAALADVVSMKLRAGLEAEGLKQERRALRLRPAELSWEWASDGLRLRFTLPPGSYATVLLRELGDITDASERATP